MDIRKPCRGAVAGMTLSRVLISRATYSAKNPQKAALAQGRGPQCKRWPDSYR
jgi:hypothetical protein